MCVDLHLSKPIADNDQRPCRFQAGGQECQQIHGRHVCPMQVIDDDYQGVSGRELLAKIQQLVSFAEQRRSPYARFRDAR